MEYRRIVLIGYRGTGKSSIGKNIAEILNLPHHDTDTLIEEREGKPVHEIFRNRGEAAFRDIESDIIHGLPVSPVVISTGGGVVLRQENIRRLRKNSQMILLTSSEEEIAARTGYDSVTAFSSAFKRCAGASPGVYRRQGPPVSAVTL